jgi:hypothetical protein
MGYATVPHRGDLHAGYDLHTARLSQTLQLGHVGDGVVVDYGDDAKIVGGKIIKQLVRFPDPIAIEGMQV